MSEQKLYCPECNSAEVLVYSKTSYMANTGEFYCHSVKTHDSYAETRCLDCDWNGVLSELVENV